MSANADNLRGKEGGTAVDAGLMFKQLPQALWVLGADGTVQDANERVFEFLGMEKESLKGKKFQEFFAPGALGQEKIAEILKQTEKDLRIDEQEAVIQNGNGVALWVLLFFQRRENDDIFVSMVDWTRGRKAEEERSRAQKNPRKINVA